METQVWVAVVSLLGVGIGGGLSYVTQTAVQRRSDRNDERRKAAELAEARRAEQLELLRQFIRIAQQAERAAENRSTTSAWKTSALDILDELWVCERMIHALLAPAVHDRARGYVKALDHVMWEEPTGDSMWDYLQEPKVSFLNAIREVLA